MRTLIIEHAEGEGAGHIARTFAAGGVELDVRRRWRGDGLPALDGFDALVVMGGPMSANDDAGHPYLQDEAALLAASARSGRLTLGVCLGAQLFARGLGARVYTGPVAEMGILPIDVNERGRADPLLSTIAGRHVVQWHRDTFELPPGAELLASTGRFAHQAFRMGPRGWAVQFHPELDPEMRADWALRGGGELRKAGVDPASLTAPGAARLDEVGRAFAERLLQQL